MKSNQKISFLVSIQIIFILVSFLSISYFQTSHEKMEHSILLSHEIRQLSDSLMFEVQKYLGGVPYAKPIETTSHLSTYLLLLKTGGMWHDYQLDPIDPQLIGLHDNASMKLDLYTNHLKKSIENKEFEINFENKDFLVLDNRKFDFNGSMDYLIQVLNENARNQSFNLIILEIGLAIINIGIHIFMILLILDILKKESQRTVKLEKFAIIGEFASRMSHDMRNPLNVIKGAMSLIERKGKVKDEDGTASKYVRMINMSIARMIYQVDDVMDFVRVTKLKLEKHSILKLLDTSIARIGVDDSIKIQLPQNDISIKCDSTKLDIVFVNLISNAIDAMKNEGTLKIRLTDNSDKIQIEIEDSGPKIPSNVLKNMFEPLYTTKEHGTGLGLASCKNIIEQHKGEISVKIIPTIFTMSLSKNL